MDNSAWVLLLVIIGIAALAFASGMAGRRSPRGGEAEEPALPARPENAGGDRDGGAPEEEPAPPLPVPAQGAESARAEPVKPPPAPEPLTPEGLPAAVSLGATPFTPVNPPLDFHGGDASSEDRLPWYLLGATLDPLSFETAPDCPAGGGRAWSARWRGPGREDSIDLSWAPQRGWDFRVRWLGATLIRISGCGDDSFSEMACRAASGFAARVERFLRQSGLPALVLPTPAEAPPAMALPDGCLMVVTIPLRARDVPEAVRLFSSLPRGRYRQRHPVEGCLLAGRCVLARTGFPDRDAALRWARSVREDDGLPPGRDPSFENGTLTLFRNACALKLALPYHAVAEVLEHFSPVTGGGPARIPLVSSAVTASMLALEAEKSGPGSLIRLDAGIEDGTVTWGFGRQWIKTPPAAPAADIEAFLAAVERISSASAPREA